MDKGDAICTPIEMGGGDKNPKKFFYEVTSHIGSLSLLFTYKVYVNFKYIFI